MMCSWGMKGEEKRLRKKLIVRNIQMKVSVITSYYNRVRTTCL